MDLLSRYRNVTVLLLVIFAQLILLGYQVKSNQDVRLIRVWAVTGITPVAKVLESVRTTTVHWLSNYINLHNLTDENQRLKTEVGKLKLETQYLRSELQSADRAVALTAFQTHSPSKMLPARVIATGTGGGTNSRVVFIDRGAGEGVARGMAIITPDGIVGKVIASYPTASQVLLVTDPTFAAGVISQKHRVRGTVRGQGHSKCMVDYIQNEEQVDKDEWFYTSGDDGVFPKGVPVGTVASAQNGNPNKQVYLNPSGVQGGLEEVLVVLEGVHQPIPDTAVTSAAIHLQAPPESEAGTVQQTAAGEAAMTTEADRMRARYKQIGEAQSHKFGEGTLGSRAPDFNLNPEEAAARAAAKAAQAAQAAASGATGGTGAAPTGATGTGPTGATGVTVTRPPAAATGPTGVVPQRVPGATGATGAARPPAVTGSTGAARPPAPTGTTGSTGATRPRPQTAAPFGGMTPSSRPPTATGATGSTGAAPRAPGVVPPAKPKPAAGAPAGTGVVQPKPKPPAQPPAVSPTNP